MIKKLLLVDPNAALVEAWENHFRNESAVETQRGFFEEVEDFDCMVSAANSFGIMDGGVDLAIRNYFQKANPEFQSDVSRAVYRNYNGYQPVGTSMIIPTGDKVHPYIAHTPTMPVPKPIEPTAVYDAMWALLNAVRQWNDGPSPLYNIHRRIEVLVCPGLGTATGGVPHSEAARLMALAWRHFEEARIHDWNTASARYTQVVKPMPYWTGQ